MRNFLLVSIPVIFILSSCGKAKLEERNTLLQSEVDSLNVELRDFDQAMTSLGEIGILLDTIEAQRDILRLNMVEGGITYQDYTDRIKDLNETYKVAEYKINELEKSQARYAGIVANLKKELAESEAMIDGLEDVVKDLEARNAAMTETILLQEEEILEMEEEYQEAQNQLSFFEERIVEMVEVAQMSEADGYYARGAAYEESAKRTKFAPKKKKETLRRALELYQQSLDLGKEEAQAKVDEISKKVN